MIKNEFSLECKRCKTYNINSDYCFCEKCFNRIKVDNGECFDIFSYIIDRVHKKYPSPIQKRFIDEAILEALLLYHKVLIKRQYMKND